MNQTRGFITFFAFAFSLLSASSAGAEIGSTFTARVTLGLCPEYAVAGTSVTIRYTPRGSAAVFTAPIISQSIDLGAGTGTFDIQLPTTLGRTPLDVTAYCQTAFGLSDASNSEDITNCEALALLDSDGDGIQNQNEDTDCTNFFGPGDYSNPDSPDSDGDGIGDLAEYQSGTSPVNAGSSPRPFVIAGAPFDPDGDLESNPVVWRPSSGTWFIRNTDGSATTIPWGLPGDIPFVYEPASASSSVGVVRLVGSNYLWLFHGQGFQPTSGAPVSLVNFGLFGDIIVPGPWETPGVTSPAVARLFSGTWTFLIYRRDGSIQSFSIGANGDLPKVQDYDGDGIFDPAVYRRSDQSTRVRFSSNGTSHTYFFGSASADATPRGDITGDGTDDISFWEPSMALFFTLKSTAGFNDTQGRAKNPTYYQELLLGTPGSDLPLSWNQRGGRTLFTVVDHTTGLRRFRANNSSGSSIQSIQWGLPGDAQG